MCWRYKPVTIETAATEIALVIAVNLIESVTVIRGGALTVTVITSSFSVFATWGLRGMVTVETVPSAATPQARLETIVLCLVVTLQAVFLIP